MRKLSLSDWASVAEIAGTVAVVISLLFVAFSLERTTAAVSGQTADDVYDAVNQVDLAVLTNPEVMMVTIKGRVDFDGLSELEKEQYKNWAIMYLDIWERMHHREKEGLIQPQTIVGWNEYFAEWTKRNLSREIWKEIRWNWPTSDFSDLVDAAMADNDLGAEQKLTD